MAQKKKNTKAKKVNKTVDENTEATTVDKPAKTASVSFGNRW